MPVDYRQIEIPWPFGGLVRDVAYEDQPPGTCTDCLNVRGYDYTLTAGSGKKRGAQRPGIAKYCPNQINGANQIQDIIHVVTADVSAPSATSIVNRVITQIAVAGGNVVKFDDVGTTAVTNGAGALLSTAPVTFSAPMFGKLYFADGVNTKYYDVATNTVSTWTPTAGSLPGSGATRAKLIELWRGRIVLSGLNTDRHNWFMSALGDADDWDYSPINPIETSAVAGNNSETGRIGDSINTAIPYSDDVLIFGCDSSIWMLNGDPREAGRLDLISDTIGMAWGRPWCKDAYGRIYFFGSRGGVFRMVVGSLPERISKGSIDEELSKVDLGVTSVRLAWDDRTQGVNVFLTNLGIGPSSSYFWDDRLQSWWQDDYGSLFPCSVSVFDGDAVGDRAVLLGGKDGYIRKISILEKNDDGGAISSYVVFGPMRLKNKPRMRIEEMQVNLALNSGTVQFIAWRGSSCQTAHPDNAGGPDFSVNLAAGRSRSIREKLNGHAFYFRMRNQTVSETWAMEYFNIPRIAVITGPGQRIF